MLGSSCCPVLGLQVKAGEEGRKSSLMGTHFPRSPSVHSQGGTEAESGTQGAKVLILRDGRW